MSLFLSVCFSLYLAHTHTLAHTHAHTLYQYTMCGSMCSKQFPDFLCNVKIQQTLFFKLYSCLLFFCSVPRRFDEAELLMRIKKEVQEVYPDLDFNNPAPSSDYRSPSPQGNSLDHRGVEVKGNQMVMMSDPYDREEMDDEEEMRRMEEEAEEERDMTNEDHGVEGSADYEDSSREHDERHAFGNDDDESCLNRSGVETEAERELKAVQEKFEREQAEDLRNQYSAFENGYRIKGNANNGSFMSVTSRFSPLNSADLAEKRVSQKSEGNCLMQIDSNEHIEEKGSSKHSTTDASFFVSGKHCDSNNAADDMFKVRQGPEADGLATKPFVVQLPDSGPVFPNPHHVTKSSYVPSDESGLSIDT